IETDLTMRRSRRFRGTTEIEASLRKRSCTRRTRLSWMPNNKYDWHATAARIAGTHYTASSIAGRRCRSAAAIMGICMSLEDTDYLLEVFAAPLAISQTGQVADRPRHEV